MMGDGFGMSFGSGFMWVFWFLLIGVTVWSINAVVGGGNSATKKRKTAMKILEESYARGEIDKEVFEQKRKDFGG